MWNRSDANSNLETLTEERLCLILTNFLRTFHGDVTHGGGFKSLNLLGNFRVRLVITSRNMKQPYFLFQKLLKLEHSKIPESFLNRFKFDVEEYIFSSVPNNNSNKEINHYTVYRSNDNVIQSKSFNSLLYLKNKNTSINRGKNIQSNLHLPNCYISSSL